MAEQRDYWRTPTQEEEGNIRYLISTLGNSSYFGLAFKASALTEAGEHTAQVHPLRFMRYVYKDPTLRKSMHGISGKPWKRFSKDFADSFAKEASQDNIKRDMIDDFALATGLDGSFFEPYLAGSDWEAMMNALREHLR